MRHLLHHYTWLLRRFWLVLLIYGILWTGVSITVWCVTKWFNTDDIAYTVHGWLPLMGALVVVRAVLADPAPGTDTFWRTRPPRWRMVWASQFLFVLTVAAPPLLAWMANGLLLNNTAGQWRKGLWDTALIVCPLLAVAGVTSLARSWYTLALGAASFAVCWVLGFLALRVGSETTLVNREDAAEVLVALLLIVPAVCCAGVWMAGLKWGGIMRRAAILSGLLFLGPALFSYCIAPPSGPARAERTLVLHTATGALRPGIQRMGDLDLEGVPPGIVAVVTEAQLALQSSSDPKPVPPVNSQNRGNPPGFRSLPSLSPLFPAATRWYHDGDIMPDPGAFRLPDFSAEKLTVRGIAKGWMVRPEIEIAVPLENGTVGEHGTRVRIRGLRVDDQWLHFQMDVWRMISLMGEIRGDGTFAHTSAHSPRRDPLVPVLHVPASSFAIAFSEGPDRAFFRSWQTGTMSWRVSAGMPLAEAMRGARWDETTLRGARLIFCRLRVEEPFVAEPDGRVLDIPAPDKITESDALVAQWISANNSARPRREAELLRAGEPALRALIARGWTESFFPWFAGPLLVTAPPGLLEEAALRDERWLSAALQAGLADPSGPVALKLLRERPGKLPVNTLAAAMPLAGPADYPALQRQLAMHRPESWNIHSGSILLSKFWAALRSLPGFDWKTPARREWRKLLATDHYILTPRNGLRFSAALAGDVTALTGERPSRSAGLAGVGLLDSPPVDNHIGADALTSSEWNQLAAMIEGLPADPASRTVWLQENRGYFLWDEALGKYRLQK